MELGNLIFGNSRGNFPVPDRLRWEKELFRLLDKIGGDSFHGEEFENDVFEIFPYYWGDCTCSFEQLEDEFYETYSHSPYCYQYDYEKFEKRHGFDWHNSENTVKELITIMEKHAISYDPKDPILGCATWCSCGFQDWENKFYEENSHEEDCLLVKDNFHYKPTGFGIQWYKYPLRDAYMNQNISLKEFKKIIDHCIQSLDGRK